MNYRNQQSALRSWTLRGLLALVYVSFCLSVRAAEKAPLLAPAFAAGEVDFGACRIFRGPDTIGPDATERALRDILGLPGAQPGAGRALLGDGRNMTGAPLAISYLLVFTDELPVGSILMNQAERIHVLKAGVTGEISVSADGIWQELPRAKRTGGSLNLATAANDTRTRAILVRSSACAPGGQIQPISFFRVLKERLGNITPLSTANAESEHTVYPEMSSPYTLRASHIPLGEWKWVNTGEDKTTKRIPRAPISDVHPCWFLLSWEKAQSMQAVYLESNIEQLELYAFTGGEGINPAVATSREWKKIRDWERAGPLIVFKEAVSTRGLKLNILRSVGGGPVSEISAYHVYQALGRNPVPEAVVVSDLPPFRIPIEAPLVGTMSLVIDAADGKRVANLQGRAPRSPGALDERWALKDYRGAPVAPGTYRYTALFMPELSIKYQMTPYPNVEMYSDNTPWPQGHSGAGAWLADHSGIGCVTVGDNGKIYFGAACAESGQALAECDLNGAKEWGCHNFVAWTGPSLLAFGKGTIFAASPAHWNLTDHAWAVNAKDKSTKTLLAAKGTNRRARGISGIAYREGKLYLAINAKADWMANAGDASDVDSDLCLPRYKVKDKEDTYGPDTRDDFKRLFRLTGTPAGQTNPGQLPGLTYLESTDFPGSRNHVLLTFKNPVHVGSLIFPFPKGGYQMQIKALKADGAYPPRPNSNKDWLDIYRSKKGTDWQVAAAPEGLTTRALCITYRNAKDDLLDGIEEDGDAADGPNMGLMDEGGVGDLLGGGGKPWVARLEGMKILRRRYEGAVDGLKIRVNSGRINELGEWDAQRTTPINENNPGIYLMEWEAEQSLRGVAIKEIDGKRTFIEVYTGPAGAIPLEGDRHWKRIATYEQARRDFYHPSPDTNHKARYIDGYVDFGEEIKTRAVRLSVVEQWTTMPDRPEGVREDRGGRDLDSTRCRVYGVAALRYLGGEAPVDPLIYERLQIHAADSGELLREIPATKPGKMTVDNKGRLYGIADKKIVVLQDDDSWKVHIDDLLAPSSLATDKEGNLYVFDGDFARKQVRVYDPAGTFLRAIGKAGGYKQGPFDPNTITGSGRHEGTDMAIDANGKLWITESSYSLKRISRWTTQGVWDRDYYGNTSYGGGGVLDITDTRRLFYANGGQTTEFGLDWKTGRTRVNAIAWMGDSPGGEYVIPVDGRTYLVNRPHFGRQGTGFVYLYEGEKGLRRVAAVGSASGFAVLRDEAFYEKLGDRVLGNLHFTWSDANGDGKPQPDEVSFIEMGGGVSWFDEDLGVHAEGMRYEVASFRPDGVPVYRTVKTPGLGQTSRRLTKTRTLAFNQSGPGGGPFNRAVDDKGAPIWAWRTEGMGVHAYYSAGPYTERQVVAEFDVIGVARDNPGEIGDIFVSNSNVGKMHIWTYDGILAGSLFRDIRDRQRLSPPAVKPGPGEIELKDTTLGQEHFSGWFGKSQKDGRYYVIMGHNFAGVAEVLGLEKARRVTGTVTVTPDDIRAIREWEQKQAGRKAYESAKVYYCPLGGEKIVDGSLGEWGGSFIHPDDYEGVEFAMHAGQENLYLAFRVGGMGPLLNKGGSGWQSYFKTGGAVDIMLGTDPEADPSRKGPAKGDLRLLLTRTPEGPKAVLYQPTVAKPDSAEAWQAKTMVFTTDFDRVAELKTVRMAYQADERSGVWVLEASVPFSELGLKPENRQRLKFDFGLMMTNKDGNEVMQRIYWSNQSTAILSDIAAEAALEPGQWGHVIFAKPGAAPGSGPSLTPELLGEKDKDDAGMTEEDLLNTLDAIQFKK
jgi:hypothetical protein